MASFAFTGNILGEATNPIGNNLLEAMRHLERHIKLLA
jgi:hypothetical protein